MSLRLDLTTLDLYVAVIEERSFARAAERKSIAISAISRRIGEFEQNFGVRLLHRRHNGVEPTAAGLAVLERARQLLRGVDQLEQELQGFAVGSRGLIRVHASESAMFGMVSDALKSFLDQHPMVNLDFQEATSPSVVRAVMENVADIGIYVGDVPAMGLEHYMFHSDRLCVLVPATHPLAGEGRVRFEQLLDDEFICQETDSATDRLMQQGACECGRVLKSRIRVGGFDAACRMVEAGLGISVTAEFITSRLAPVMELVQLELAEEWAIRPHAICVRNFAGLPTAAQRLLSHIINYGKEKDAKGQAA